MFTAESNDQANTKIGTTFDTVDGAKNAGDKYVAETGTGVTVLDEDSGTRYRRESREANWEEVS